MEFEVTQLGKCQSGMQKGSETVGEAGMWECYRNQESSHSSLGRILERCIFETDL